MLPGTSPAESDIHTLFPALREVAARFGTPAYVIDMAGVAAAAARLESTFAPPWLRLYSLKANDLPAVTSFLHARGWEASVVSAGEWGHARTAVANESVAFEGIGKTDAQLALAVNETAAGRPLRWLVIESVQDGGIPPARGETGTAASLAATQFELPSQSPVTEPGHHSPQGAR